MYKLCVFAGTTEGRRLVEFLSGQDVAVTACVATEYGGTLLRAADNVTVCAKRMAQDEMERMFSAEEFDCVVDATHPYATVVTENIAAACRNTGREYLRLARESGSADGAVFVEDADDAVEFLNATEGNILLTTGSKELLRYTGIANFPERVYARVLPMEDSLRACKSAGLQPSHIFAMQGPFSREMNLAILRSTGAGYLVTKLTGHAGGLEEKLAAAAELGVTVVAIGRPQQVEGLDFSELIDLLCRRYGLAWQPQVCIVGIGAGEEDTLTREAHDAIKRADCLIGAARMLEFAVQGQGTFCAIAPEKIAQFILSHREHREFAVLMSGDTGFFSGTRKLLPLLKSCGVRILPGLSSMSCLCARLGTSYEDVVPVSIHGRDHDIVPDVLRHRRVFALVGGENGMPDLCRHLTEAGLGDVRISVGERLGYGDEKITQGTAAELMQSHFHTLSVALIEHDRPHIVTHGVRDEMFQRGNAADGAVVPMTKREVRAVSLSQLQLTQDAVCWDIGAGTGSVSIEMAMQATNGWVYAVEKKRDAIHLMEENRKKFFVENLTIVSGNAPEVCIDLPAPTHVFIGGSSGNLREILALARQKNPAVRIVATAIALETVGELTNCLNAMQWRETEVVSLSAARDRRAGSYHLMTGQNPVTIFTFQA